eukprot:s408_g19.t3
MSQRDAYAILGISRSSGPDEIKKAYRAKALKYHPDKVPDEDRGEATARFQEIQSAFEQICKGDRRLNWDLGPISKSELVRACEGGDFSTVKILLEESIDLNGTDSTGRTPLMFAAGAGHLEVIRLLLEHQADVTMRNCAGHTCVMFAVGGALKASNLQNAQTDRTEQYLQAVRLLLDTGAPVNGVTAYGLSALMLASTSGRVEMVELLLQREADVALASDIGLTALVMASDKGHVATVRLLLEKMADANSRHGNGKTPLMSAAAQAYTEVVSELLKHSADVNAQAENGYSALLYALETQLKDGLVCPIEGSLEKPGLEDTVRILLDAVPLAAHQDIGRRSALAFSVLAKAADVNLMGPRQTALDVLEASGNLEMLQRLRERQSNRRSETSRGEAQRRQWFGFRCLRVACERNGGTAVQGEYCMVLGGRQQSLDENSKNQSTPGMLKPDLYQHRTNRVPTFTIQPGCILLVLVLLTGLALVVEKDPYADHAGRSPLAIGYWV